MSDMEITALVLSEHDVFRRGFAALEDAEEPAAAWAELAAQLEVHAVAEEELFYPGLADHSGGGAAESDQGVRDHNEIRHAVAAVGEHEAGTEAWWESVRAAQEVNATHMAQEEREFFPDYKAAVDEQAREDLGLRWLAFHDEHDKAQGLSGHDADPQEVRDASVPEGPPEI